MTKLERWLILTKYDEIIRYVRDLRSILEVVKTTDKALQAQINVLLTRHPDTE